MLLQMPEQIPQQLLQQQPPPRAAQQTAPAEKQDVTLRMWGAEEDQPMLQGMIDSFKEHYADYANFDIQLGTESESTAKDTVLTDIEAAADVYSFASDQLIDLVNAGALRSVDDMGRSSGSLRWQERS